MSERDTAALKKAVTDVESAITALSLAKDPVEKKKLAAEIKIRLQEAEKLKSTSTGSSFKARPSLSKEPLSTREQSKSEQILVLKAGFLNGTKFPPWSKEPTDDDFTLKPGDELYLDDATFSLSSFQQQVFTGWERPAVALSSTNGDAPTMDHINSIDLVQDASTDCSVVASLCAGVARAMRGHARLLRPVLFPQDRQAGVPKLSHNGKYIVRLNFNGCYRRVVIDDRLPKSKTDRVIHVIDRQNPTLLWPALVEKAYLKIRGGYDFPGSNSATDLWIITGWIPEQVFLQSDDLDLDTFWTTMAAAFLYGDVLVTMGTGKMSGQIEKEIGLAGEHDYAVLDIREVKGQRLMLVKNPWCEGTDWYQVPRARSRLEVLSEEEDVVTQSPRDLLNADDQLSPGTFWMDINNAAQYYESIYLNWNPSIFSHRQDLHFHWNLETLQTRGLHASLYNNPQFSVSATAGGTIWLLLCRHLRNTATDNALELDLAGYIAVSTYAAGGKRTMLPSRVMEKSNFVDSPQILLKVDDCLPNTPYTVIPLEQELSSSAHTFTLSAFSASSLSLEQASPSHKHTISRTAEWTVETAGGNTHSAAYSTNPQFAVRLNRPTKLTVLLESVKEELNVHLKLVHGKGQRIRNIRNRDIVFDSSDYRRRCCVAKSKTLIDAGTYTMICSTFEPQQFGSFDVLIESDEPVELSLLPREHAGRLQSVHKATFPPQCTNIVAKLTPLRLANIYIDAKKIGQATSSVPLKISIEQGHGMQCRLLKTSVEPDQSVDDIASARLDNFSFSPDMLRYGDVWVVLERICIADQAQELCLELHCFVDSLDAFTLDQWQSVDG